MRNASKFILFLVVFIVVVQYHFVYAGIFINEIMYDLKVGSDDGREWVEVFNDADVSVDLSTFKFFEGETNHKFKLIQGDINIPAKSYAVIVSDEIKFKTDWPIFCCTIFDSSFSLNNSGETLILKNKDLIVDEYTYQSSFGGAGDGKSLQKINGVWLGATPTPGVENQFSIPPLPLSPIKKNGPVSAKVSAPAEQKDLTETKKLTQDEISSPIDIQGDLTAATSEDRGSLYPFIIILILFLGVSGGVVYFIRQKKIVPNNGEDFDLLD